MDSRYRYLTLGIPLTQSMPPRDVNAASRLAEASWRRDYVIYGALEFMNAHHCINLLNIANRNNAPGRILLTTICNSWTGGW